MKKIFALLLVLAFLLPGCSAKDNLKTYDTGLGLQLSLPDGFEEFDSEDFAYAISNEDKVALDSAKMVVFVNFENDDYLKTLGGFYKNVEEYGKDISAEDTIKTFSGMVGDYYVFDYDYDDFYYKIACVPGNGGYYIVNFCCFKDSKDLPARFDEYIKQIKVTTVRETMGYKTYSNSHLTIDLPESFEEEEDNADLYTDYVGVRFSLFDEEFFKEKGHAYPASDKEALEAIREIFGDTDYEIKNDGDLYYYVYPEEEYTYVYALKKASDGYVCFDGITYNEYAADMLPLFVKWFKSATITY